MILTVEDHGAQIQAMLDDDQSYRAIARELGCNHETVSGYVRKHLPRYHEQRSASRNTSLMKILTIDIETRPNLAYIWDIWNQNVQPERILDEKEVICWAAKWLGEDEIFYASEFHDGKSIMVQMAYELLDQADAVVTYNGARFDIPHLNLEFLREGLSPPSPYKQIDLLQTIKRRFKFTSNKLSHVSSKLGIGGKLEHEGFALWMKCIDGDPVAWAKMREYNIQDVQLTEDLYRELLPWIEQHPSFGALLSENVCPNCGSDALLQSGTYNTKTGTYRRYHCQNCGKWSRATRRSYRTEITETAN